LRASRGNQREEASAVSRFFWVGFDVGKAFHWVCVLDDEGDCLLSRRVEATEADIEAALSEIERLCAPSERMVGLDLTGGPATLLEALLLVRGERVFRVSGIAVNRARETYVGGERKSDPGDARVIADQLRFRRRRLPEIRHVDERLAELRVLVSYRRDLAQDNARRIVRLRALLSGVFPGLEATLDLRKQGPLLAVSRVATPAAARRLGEARLSRWLKSRGVRKANILAQRILAAAKAQRCELPAAQTKAALVAEIASEVLRDKKRLAALDERLEELVGGDPGGALVMTLPGMGPCLTAEFLAEAGHVLVRFGSADRLAAAAGIVPVTRASGASAYQRRAKRGNRILKRVFYQSAFCSLIGSEASKAFYERKRQEGKTHKQAVMALARRRVNVLWAMLRDGRAYEEQPLSAA
jgi:transposase